MLWPASLPHDPPATGVADVIVLVIVLRDRHRSVVSVPLDRARARARSSSSCLTRNRAQTMATNAHGALLDYENLDV
jgi:hypothetical protein